MLFWFSTIIPIMFGSVLLKKHFLIIPWSMLFLLSAFRYNVGSDYPNYVMIYNEIIAGTAGSLLLGLEPGYLLLIHFSDLIGGNFQLVFFLFSFFTILLMYKTMDSYLHTNTEKLLALLLFIPMFYFPSLSIMRQFLAIAIFFYALKYIISRDFLKYLFFIFIGFLFHKSMILMIPMYWLLNIKFSEKVYLFYITLAVVFFFISPVSILSFLLGSLDVPYVHHVLKGEIQMSLFGKINTLVSFLLISYFAFKLNRKDRLENIVITAMFIYVFIRIISIDFAVLLRVAVFFVPFFILFIVILYRNMVVRYKFNKIFTFISLLSLIFVYTSVGLYHKAFKDGSYNQYAVNFALFGDNIEPIRIYGDYNDLYINRDKE